MKLKALIITLIPFFTYAQEAKEITDKKKKEKKKTEFVALPNLAYAPETSLVLGVAGFYNNVWGADKENNKTSSHNFYAQYTLKKQISFGMRSDSWFNTNKSHLIWSWDYNKYPFSFYPLGANSSNTPESYTTKFFNGFVRYEHFISKNLYAGLQLETRLEKLVETEKGKILEQKTIKGSDGFKLFGIAPTLTYDSRDNVLYPTTGDYHQLKIRHFNKALGDQNSFTIFDLDLRKYYTINKYNHILAFNLAYQFVDKNMREIPFQMLPGVGNERIQRGYFEGRYRSTNRMVFKSEYRFPISNRFKASVFGSVSTVDDSFGKLFKSKFSPAGGVGVRYRLGNNGMHIRIDLAYGMDFSPYVNVGEAF